MPIVDTKTNETLIVRFWLFEKSNIWLAKINDKHMYPNEYERALLKKI